MCIYFQNCPASVSLNIGLQLPILRYQGSHSTIVLLQCHPVCG
jgi:hypothetical protein